MTATATIAGERPLYVPPLVSRFVAADRERLVEALRDLETVTRTDAILGTENLKLRSNCTTADGGYRYTSDGFRQICRLLGPGVWRLIPDLAGTRKRIIPDEHLNGTMAIGIFNSLVELRFSSCTPYRLVRNTRTRMIDGVIGQTHRQLNNLNFFNNVEEAMQLLSPRPEFYTGMLIGRRLVCWWRAPEPFLTLPIGNKRWLFFLGYYFRNDEITGAAARASLAIFTRAGVCLAPFKQFGTTVNHHGKDFMLRLSAELQRVALQSPPLDEWREKIGRSLAQNLGFAADSDQRARRQRSLLLAANLRRLHVDFSVAQEVVDAAMRFGLAVGASPEETQPIRQEQVFASRTVADLLVCLLHLARRFDVSRREVLEQAAFNLLVNRFF